MWIRVNLIKPMSVTAFVNLIRYQGREWRNSSRKDLRCLINIKLLYESIVA